LKEENMPDEVKIPFSDWEKLDLRVAKILEVEDHPRADKLYLLQVDLGSEKRQLVAGLKPYYSKEDLKGKLCIVFVNLESAVIRGEKSEGMLLAAQNLQENKVILIAPEREIEPGSKVR